MFKIEKDNPTLIEHFLKSKYPLTVVHDRYGGVYSNGRYLAFPIIYYEIPKEVDGSDIVCMEFWEKENKLNYLIGKGSTPQGAIDDLMRKYERL